MTRVLITAFEPYERFQTNASWLSLVALTGELPDSPTIVTRRYPVDFAAARSKLEKDLEGDFDFALHLGQAPGSSQIRLESIALNVGQEPVQPEQSTRILAVDGPVAYQSPLPLREWAARLRAAGIPAAVSYHAGTYLCNATLYWSQHLAEQRGLRTRALFVHLPLELSQAVSETKETPSMSAATTAAALRILLTAMEDLTLSERPSGLGQTSRLA